MRILLYTHFFAPSIGGVETTVRTLAEGLGRRGAQVTVATETPDGRTDGSEFAFRVVRRPGLRGLAKLIRGADVVHIAGPAFAPLLLCWLSRKPVAVEHHVYQAICPNGMLFFEPNQTVCPGHFMAGRHRECLRCNAHQGSWRSFRLWVGTFPRLWLCRRVAANISVSAHVDKRLRLPRSVLIYHGIADASGPHPPGPEPASPVHFAYVGRMVSTKGVPLLIRAAIQLKQEGERFRLLLIGDGPERMRLEQDVRAAGLSDCVNFTGQLAGERLARALKYASVLVMPSISEETAGLAAIEQMMRGKALIVASIGGLEEVVGDTGLKFAPGDSEGLAACMRRVLREPRIIEQLGSAARERARTLFRLEEMVTRHLHLYEAILRRPADVGDPALKDELTTGGQGHFEQRR